TPFQCGFMNTRTIQRILASDNQTEKRRMRPIADTFDIPVFHQKMLGVTHSLPLLGNTYCELFRSMKTGGCCFTSKETSSILYESPLTSTNEVGLSDLGNPEALGSFSPRDSSMSSWLNKSAILLILRSASEGRPIHRPVSPRR